MKVGKCHSCGLKKDLNEDLANAMQVVPCGILHVCQERGWKGKEGGYQGGWKGCGMLKTVCGSCSQQILF